MNNIVIVEDKLKRAISLANQFVEFSKIRPELHIEVSSICYFCANTKQAEQDIHEQDGCGFSIKHITLLNFNQIMDEYVNSKENKNFLIMDYMLDGDGSDGTPTQRVNIRYAINKERYKTNQLWFYTGTGTVNQQALSKLVEKKHVFDILEVDENTLKLCLENDDFIKELTGNGNYEG